MKLYRCSGFLAFLFCFFWPGNIDNTFPNPALKRDRSNDKGRGKAGVSKDMEAENWEGGKEEEEEYYPAYLLSDWSLERAGRGHRKFDTLACELRYTTPRRDKHALWIQAFYAHAPSALW